MWEGGGGGSFFFFVGGGGRGAGVARSTPVIGTTVFFPPTENVGVGVGAPPPPKKKKKKTVGGRGAGLDDAKKSENICKNHTETEKIREKSNKKNKKKIGGNSKKIRGKFEKNSGENPNLARIFCIFSLQHFCFHKTCGNMLFFWRIEKKIIAMFRYYNFGVYYDYSFFRVHNVSDLS